MANGLLSGGAERRAMLGGIDQALMQYIPPHLRPLMGLLADANPVVSIERAGTASQGLLSGNATPMQRVGYAGDMLSNMAGVAAPAMVAGRAGLPAANAIQEGLLGASQAAGIPQFVADESGALRLFHGSPHDFDKFSMDKIGTGEGAQAYGHGLYFAEAEDTAKAYRDALRFPRIDGASTPVERVADDLNYHRGNVDAVRGIYEGMLARGTPEAQAMAREKLAALPDAVERFRGRLYEVNVNANPEDFLDWDKPLSEQSKAIMALAKSAQLDSAKGPTKAKLKAFQSGTENPEMGIVATGQDLNRALSSYGESGAAASNAFRSAGIPGIRYLDAGSRGAGDGSRNYVVFDENLIDIVRKYGIAGAAALLGMSQADVAQAAEQQNRMTGLLGPVAPPRAD